MRWIVRITTVLIVLVIGVVGLVFLLPADKIGELASAQLEKATGRKLTLSGRFSPTIYPVLGVKTGPLTISNANWAAEKYMVSAQGASVGVGFLALLGGELDVQKLVLNTPVIHLERNKDGVANWELSGSMDASDTTGDDSPSGAGGFTLNKGSIEDGLVTYTDATSGQDITISEINADFSLPKSAATALNGTAVWNGNKAKIDLSIADLQKLLTGDVSNLAGSLSIGSLVASLNGQVKVAQNAAPLINGQYDIQMPDFKAISALTGVRLPDLLHGAKNIATTGTLMASDAGLSLVGKSSVTLNGLPIEVNTEITGPENWADTLRVELALDVTGRDAFTFSWAGLVNGKTQNADGTIRFVASDLPRTLKAVGQEIGFPKGTGKTASVKGVVRVRNGKNTLSKATFSLDQNSFNGDVELAFDRRPFIAANLSAGDLDFSAFTSDETGGSASSSGGGNSGWSKEPIRISGLDAINANVNLKARSVDLGVSKLDKTDINARLRDGSLYLTLRDVRAYQGVLSGNVSFRAGNVVSFKSDIKATGVQLEPLLGRLLDLHRLTGAGNTTLNMSGTGSSLYQIMHSLSGDGTVKIDKGSFKGIDLAAMMRNLQKAFGGFEGATEFTSLTGSFTMKGGVLQNVDMSLISPLFKAEGKGQIDVGEQNMSYTVTPTSLSETAKFSVPVDITGPWNNLKFRPDLGSLIDLLSKGKLKVQEDDTKAKVEAKLRKELGIVEDENAQDVDIEDAAKEKLEDKLKDELGNALKNLFD